MSEASHIKGLLPMWAKHTVGILLFTNKLSTVLVQKYDKKNHLLWYLFVGKSGLDDWATTICLVARHEKPPCQFYNTGFIYFNLSYIITTLKSFNIKKYYQLGISSEYWGSETTPLLKSSSKSNIPENNFRDLSVTFMLVLQIWMTGSSFEFNQDKFETCFKDCAPVLCIFTGKRFLHSPFAGQNHLFWCFHIFFCKKDKKEKACKKEKNKLTRWISTSSC